MKKSELLELLDELEKFSYYPNHSNFKLIKYLLKDYDEDAVELKALTKNIAKQIIDLLVDCYTSEQLIAWLDKNDWNVFHNIHNAEIKEYSEFRGDELIKILRNGNYLFRDEENEILVLSW